MRAARKPQPKNQGVLQANGSSKTSEPTVITKNGALRTAQLAAWSRRSSAGTSSTATTATVVELKQPDLLWPVPLHERTPEQTALIALQGLLEAREAHIARLEVCVEQ